MNRQCGGRPAWRRNGAKRINGPYEPRRQGRQWRRYVPQVGGFFQLFGREPNGPHAQRQFTRSTHNPARASRSHRTTATARPSLLSSGRQPEPLVARSTRNGAVAVACITVSYLYYICHNYYRHETVAPEHSPHLGRTLYRKDMFEATSDAAPRTVS